MSAFPPTPGDPAIGPPLRNWMDAMLMDSMAYDGAITALQGNRRPRNVLINGAFQVWQRGTSFASSATYAYGPDRWMIGLVTNCTLSRQTGPSGFQFCSRVQRNVGIAAATTIYFGCSMETVDSIALAGKTVTISFQARAGAGYSGGPLSCFLRSGTGTDQNVFAGAMTGSVDFVQGTSTLSTDWQQFEFSGTVPTNCNELAVFFFYNPTGVAGAADYYEIAAVQLEVSPAFTVFDHIPFAETYAMCQRYYQKSFPYQIAPAQNTGVLDGVLQYQCWRAGVNTTSVMLPMKSPMRHSVPTWTFYNPSAANANWRNRGTAADSGAATVGTTGEHVNYILNPQVAGDLVGGNIAIHWTADGEL